MTPAQRKQYKAALRRARGDNRKGRSTSQDSGLVVGSMKWLAQKIAFTPIGMDERLRG